MENKFKKFKEITDKANNIAIFGHRNIDGDSMGSTLAIGTILEKLGKKISYFTPTTPSPIYSFIPKYNIYSTEFDYGDYDLLIFCDIGSQKEMLEKFYKGNEKYFEKKDSICIDHHESNEWYGTLLNIIETKTPSACDIAFKIIYQEYKELLDKDIATYLLMGIITDTGSFQHSNTNPESFEHTSILTQYGADRSAIIDNLFRKNSFNGLKFYGKLLERMQLVGKVVYTYFDEEDIGYSGIDTEKAKAIIEYIRGVEEADVYATFFAEHNYIKGSLRSKGINVANIAKKIGGGGHAYAAGFRFNKKKNFLTHIEETVKLINEEIEK